MKKEDYKKTHKILYKPNSKSFSIVDVPPMLFLMIDGKGDPNTAKEYQDALQALYPLAYKIKFKSKLDLGMDYIVPPLEGLWWADDMSDFSSRKKENWQWRMMIMQPDWITPEFVEAGRAEIAKKASKSLPKVRLEMFDEGTSVQILHIGPYDAEGPVLDKLHNQWLPDNGYKETGLHHEIYLNDPRKVAAGQLKTILRQPITDL